MQWNLKATEAVKRVPFFVRKRVRARVEEEALRHGDAAATLEHVERCRRRFLERREDEVKGYEVETCFGRGGCPNRAVTFDNLAEEIEHLLDRRKVRDVLVEKVAGPLKFHHEFRVSVSDCPNGCSRPQIADVGIIGAMKPAVGKNPCDHCGRCLAVCRESAISLEEEGPVIFENRCLSCGACVRGCPAGALEEGQRGYRILLGGKLGRHPRLGEEIPGIQRREEVLSVIEDCLDLYRDYGRKGERLGSLLDRVGIKKIGEKCSGLT